MPKKLWYFMLLAVGSSACGLANPKVGAIVAPGVGEAIIETRANQTDVLHVRVLFPANDDGSPKAGPFPAMVYVQGGFVPTERYAWQGEFLASQGWVVALPDHTMDLAFFSIENGIVARDLLISPPANSLLTGLVDASKVTVAGHSLGGVVAIKLALLKGFRAVVAQASYSDAADDAQLPDLGMPSLFLAGAIDCDASLTSVQTGWAKMPSPTALVVLPGMTHYQFTNSDAEDTTKCPPQSTLAASHARVQAAMTGFLNGVFDPSGDRLGEAALRAVDGAEVSVR